MNNMSGGVALAAILAAAGSASAQGSWYAVPLKPVLGISRDGLVLVGQNPATLQAATWTVSNGMVDLPPDSPPEDSSTATAASSDGTVVVGTMIVGGSARAFRFTAASGKVDLGSPAPGYDSPEATGVSADGSVVVGLVRGDPGGWA
jgi:probable HAF family extracellular repeat protein